MPEGTPIIFACGLSKQDGADDAMAMATNVWTKLDKR